VDGNLVDDNVMFFPPLFDLENWCFFRELEDLKVMSQKKSW
jgi:hypothetical protein